MRLFLICLAASLSLAAPAMAQAPQFPQAPQWHRPQQPPQAPVPRSPAPQRQPCAHISVMVEQLEGRYNETPHYRALQSNGHLLQIFRCTEECKGDKPSWTIVTTRADGMACIASAGHFWQEIDPVLPGQPT